MKRPGAWLACVLAVGLLPAVALAGHDADVHSPNMSLVANFNHDGTYRQGSDLAFWGNLAVLGNLSPGGFRLLDISDPARPTLIGHFVCAGTQSDVSVWKTLVFVSVDAPRSGPECEAGPASQAQILAGTAWEGIRIVSIKDPARPVQIAAVRTDCGSHTHTLVPDLRHRDARGRPDPRVLLYVLSYPLGGQGVNCNAETHRKISVVAVPLQDPAAAAVISTPDVSPAVGCHDVTVLLDRRVLPERLLAAAACITESQIWDISDPVNPRILAHIVNPEINIHHSSAFSWDGRTVVIGDELGGAAVAPGCLTDGEAPLGALWFYDVSDPMVPVARGFFQIPQPEGSLLCTAHNFNVVPLESGRNILVSAWYAGGTTVVDFTDPANPVQIGYYIPKEGGAAVAWSSYWYNGLIYANNYESGSPSRGFDVLGIDDPAVVDHILLPRLNPQTQEPLPEAAD